jgi:secondary thiamine-phosphate synthase enzyme
MYQLNIRTSAAVDFREITDDVQKVVDSSGTRDGVCYIYIPHTTAALTINEHADPSVIEDISAVMDKLVPQQGSYRHGEGNTPAHVKASLFGSSQVVFIEAGKLILGTWQGIFLCEFDGPRTRTVLITILTG